MLRGSLTILKLGGGPIRIHCPLFPVVEQGRLTGIVTLENMGELVMLRMARS